MIPVTETARARTALHQALLLSVAVLTATACGGGGTISTLTCGPSIGPSVISGDITVTYSASLTGTGAVTSVTYVTDTGPIVVNNPALPWQVVVVNATSPAAIRAAGRVTTGTITIGYSAVGAPARSEQNSAICEQTARVALPTSAPHQAAGRWRNPFAPVFRCRRRSGPGARSHSRRVDRCRS